MPRLIFLGTSNSISDEKHENTHMILVGSRQSILIDCVNSPLLRLQKAGVDFNDVTDLVATHFHPDHICGVPQFLLNMWLMRRRKPLTIHGLGHTLDRLDAMMELYGWREWPNFYEVTLHRVPDQELAPVLETPEFCLASSPMKHFVPTMGLRIQFPGSQKVVAYSCDTEPCPQILGLANGADLLIHEATGAGMGHSSASQAGLAAEQAGARALFLIHYPTGPYAFEDICAEARQSYHGPVTKAQDFMSLEF